jgi:hypothetical protein
LAALSGRLRTDPLLQVEAGTDVLLEVLTAVITAEEGT